MEVSFFRILLKFELIMNEWSYNLKATIYSIFLIDFDDRSSNFYVRILKFGKYKK